MKSSSSRRSILKKIAKPDLFAKLMVTSYNNNGGITTVFSESHMMPEMWEVINTTAHSFGKICMILSDSGGCRSSRC